MSCLGRATKVLERSRSVMRFQRIGARIPGDNFSAIIGHDAAPAW